MWESRKLRVILDLFVLTLLAFTPSLVKAETGEKFYPNRPISRGELAQLISHVDKPWLPLQIPRVTAMKLPSTKLMAMVALKAMRTTASDQTDKLPGPKWPLSSTAPTTAGRTRLLSTSITTSLPPLKIWNEIIGAIMNWSRPLKPMNIW